MATGPQLFELPDEPALAGALLPALLPRVPVLAAAPDPPEAPMLSDFAPELADEVALADELAPPTPPWETGRAFAAESAWPVRLVPLAPPPPTPPAVETGLAMEIELLAPVFALLLACDETLTLPVLPLRATGAIVEVGAESAPDPLAAAATPVPTRAQNRPTRPTRTRFI